MDRLRSAFNRMIKNEQYSRFTLQPTEDGEGHAEIKLSDEVNEADNQVCGSPSYRPRPHCQNRYTLCVFVVGLLIFAAGCMVGYFSQHKPQAEPVSCELGAKLPTTAVMTTTTTVMTATTKKTPEVNPAVVVPTELEWNDIVQLLKQKLTTQSFTQTLSDFDKSSRAAGSGEDEQLAAVIMDEFKSQSMDPWSDNHYVQLQTPDSQNPNCIYFGSSVLTPKGYLAYSAKGRVTGKLVYGNYGRQEDLEVLQKNGIGLNGNVLLLRVGKISFAEQVDNAAAKGAAAVLIYPDPEQHDYHQDTPLYGHVHMGSGDPYTPGFPSFNQTQFPPTRSSGLPKIPAQTITPREATTLLQSIGGPAPPASSGFRGMLASQAYTLGGQENITVEVNNVMVTRQIHNVFGVIKGFADPDRYVVLGAQRDAWGTGYTKAAVGTTVLVELARAVRQMEKDGFRPRRSLVFASWDAGEYGSIGATEWLEGYMTSINKRVFTYISLDGVVMGRGSFVASASPLLYSLLETTMKWVQDPFSSGSLHTVMGKGNWAANVMKTMTVDDPAYPFLAFAGIPSISFHFTSSNSDAYMYYGTEFDNKDHLNYMTTQKTSELAVAAAQVAGQMALRLVHDHLLRLDTQRYALVLNQAVGQIYRRNVQLSRSGQLQNFSPVWLVKAVASFKRAVSGIRIAIDNTDLTDPEACRILNDRLMAVESNLLSPYVSPTETPFRHVLFGWGPHTLASMAESTDMKELRVQLALGTWTLQGCANAMMGNIWDINYFN